MVTGATLLVLAVLFTLLATGGAKGDVAAHCARLEVQSQARERLVTGHGRRVVVIGDSYSVGLGLSRPQASWPSRLPGRVHVYGFSGSGFSTHSSACHGVQYAARAPDALRGGASLVVVEGGLNDCDQPEADVRSGFRALMVQLRGHRVLVVGPPPAPAREAAALRVDALLGEESGLAGVRYLSMANGTFPYLADHLHLTPSGHRAFGQIVARAVAG
jgi:acyl-CoA thioesterase-1